LIEDIPHVMKEEEHNASHQRQVKS